MAGGEFPFQHLLVVVRTSGGDLVQRRLRYLKTCLNLGTHPLHHPEEKDILPRAQGKQMPSIGYFISKILLLDETKQKKTKKNNFDLNY